MKEELIDMPAHSVYSLLLSSLRAQRRIKLKRSIKPRFIEATMEMGMATIRINIKGENEKSHVLVDFDFRILYLFVVLVYSFFVFLSFWLRLDISVQILLTLLVIELGALIPWNIKRAKDIFIKEIKGALTQKYVNEMTS